MNKDGLHPRAATEAARKQFDSAFQMLVTAVDVCPDEVWQGTFFHFPYPLWYQVYHAAYFLDYWFRDSYDGSEFRTMVFDARIPPEFEHEPPLDAMVSREGMRSYLAGIHAKTARIFNGLHDGLLSGQLISGVSDDTYIDMIIGQIRHVMYNIGYINAVFRSLGMEESDWYSYNER